MSGFALAEERIMPRMSRARFLETPSYMSVASVSKRRPDGPRMAGSPPAPQAMAPGAAPVDATDAILASLRLHKDIGLGQTLFGDVAWDEVGDALLAGDFAGLSEPQKGMLQRLAEALRSAARAKGHAEPDSPQARRLALGLIARRAAGRAAERFARKALRDAPLWLPVAR